MPCILGFVKELKGLAFQVRMCTNMLCILSNLLPSRSPRVGIPSNRGGGASRFRQRLQGLPLECACVCVQVNIRCVPFSTRKECLALTCIFYDQNHAHTAVYLALTLLLPWHCDWHWHFFCQAVRAQDHL